MAGQMPTEEWWQRAHQSFKCLKRLIEPSWLREQERHGESHCKYAHDECYHVEHVEYPDQNTRNVRAARLASLPAVTVLPAGNHRLGLTATNEPLECVAFGTVSETRFIELFWEAIPQFGPDIVVHEVQSTIPRILFNIFSKEFDLKYIRCEVLIRRHPDILSASDAFLEDRNNCTQAVQDIVNDLKRDSVTLSHGHQHAYHYIRAWRIAHGISNTTPGFNSQDFVKICGPISCKEWLGSSLIVTRFFEHFNIDHGLARGPLGEPPVEEDWDRILLAAENKPFHEKMGLAGHSLSNYLRVTLLYSGSSKVKGGEWLSMVDRKVRKLKERLEARVPQGSFRIWPQRLVSSRAEPSDDMYEGNIMIGIDCTDAEIPLVNEVAQRWEAQIREDDTTIERECFIFVGICDLKSIIEDPLKQCTRVWPKPVIKPPEENRSQQENDSDEPEKSRNRKDSDSNSPNQVKPRHGLDLKEIPKLVLKSEENRSKQENDYSSSKDDDPSAGVSKPVTEPSQDNRSKQEKDSQDPGVEGKPLTSESRKTNHSTEINDSNAKGPKLRRAIDVLNRLRHDREYSIDDFIVGYKDRHGGVKEKAAAEWKIDTTHEEFIPEHRIEYFRKKGDFMWDKSTKIDKVFKSGNSN